MFTTRNSNTVGSANDAICFEVMGNLDTEVEIKMTCHAGNSIVATSVDWGTANHRGNINRTVTIGELLGGRVAIRMGKPSSWIVVHRAQPRKRITASESVMLKDCPPGNVYLRVTQANGQMAWSSPVYLGEGE